MRCKNHYALSLPFIMFVQLTLIFRAKVYKFIKLVSLCLAQPVSITLNRTCGFLYYGSFNIFVTGILLIFHDKPHFSATIFPTLIFLTLPLWQGKLYLQGSDSVKRKISVRLENFIDPSSDSTSNVHSFTGPVKCFQVALCFSLSFEEFLFTSQVLYLILCYLPLGILFCMCSVKSIRLLLIFPGQAKQLPETPVSNVLSNA